MRIPIRCLRLIGAASALIVLSGSLCAQTDTNEGIGPSNIEGELGDRLGVVEARQAERIARELKTAKSQLREAKRVAATRSDPAGEVKSGGRPSTRTTGGAPRDNRWRYAYHRGRWWYWLPSDSWVFYDNQHWVGYDERTYARYSETASRGVEVRSNHP